MDQITVSLDGRDHLIGENETTVCGLPVPIGSSRVDKTDPCSVCFPAQPAVNVTASEKPKAKAAKKG